MFFIFTYFIYLFHILKIQPGEKLLKAIHSNQNCLKLSIVTKLEILLKIYLLSIYFDMSLEGSIKGNIDELMYEAIETIRGKKHKILNEFSICN